MRSRRTLSALALLSGASMLAGCAGATTDDAGSGDQVTLQMAVYLGPTAPPSVTMQWAADEISQRSGGEIELEIFFAGGLLEPQEIIPGVAQQRADMGLTNNLYNPGDLPLTQATTVPFQSDNAHTLSAAVADLWESNEAFRQEWEGNNVRPLTFVGTPTGIVAAQEQIESIDWFDGKNVRATSYTANALQAVGANPIGITVNEIYEGMERGTIDAYASMLLDTVPSVSLQEVAPHIMETGLGTYAVNVIVISPQVWDGLSAEHQAVFEEVFAEFPEQYLQTFSAIEDEACDVLLEVGGSATVWSDAEQQRWIDALGDSVIDDWRDSVNAGGHDGDAFWEAFQEALAANQYEELLSGVERCAAR